MMEDENLQTEEFAEMQNQEHENVQTIDYYTYSLQDLISAMESFCTKDLVEKERKEIEKIRSIYYSKLKSETETARKEYLAEHESLEGFAFQSHEQEFKEVYGRVKELRNQIAEEHQKEQAKNLQKRLEIIEKIESLTNNAESMGKVFSDFKALQEEWKTIGEVAPSEDKTIWEKYHLVVGRFYEYAKIDRELRDLDQKKNYEAKVALCEKAEELTKATQIVKAFAELQVLHEEWKKIGPVKEDLKDALWERFKSATTTINKAHQDYFESLRKQETENLIKKTALCEQIEAIVANLDAKTIKQWNTITESVLDIQKQWKTIGYAPQKQNNAIYERFSKACNEFFTAKKSFLGEIHDVENENKKLKLALCEKAEEMQSRTDWKDAANAFVQIQKEWKTIGNVSMKDSQKLWIRFQNACNAFYEAKKAFEGQKEQELQNNVVLKEAVISKVAEISTDDKETALKSIAQLQEEWTKIAVPSSAKADLQKRFSAAINELLEKLQIEKSASDDMAYKIKISSMLLESNGEEKVAQEVKQLKKRIASAQSELAALENNIGFFNMSKGASTLISSVEKNIDKTKKDIASLEQKLHTIKNIMSSRK